MIKYILALLMFFNLSFTIANETEINFSSRDLHKSFVEAALTGNYERMTVLLDQGADPSGVAAGMQSGELTNRLISRRDKKALDILWQHKVALTDTLPHAVEVGDTSVIKYLIRHSASVMATNNDLMTGLILASKLGRIDIVETIILEDVISCIDMTDKYKRNALTWAIVGGGKRPDKYRLQIVRALLRKGIRTDGHDREGKTALDYASEGKYRHWTIARLLRKNI